MMACLFSCGVWICLIQLLVNGSEAMIQKHRSYRRIRATQRSKSKDSITFPGSSSNMSFKPKIPEECERIGICGNVPDYPSSYVEQLVNEMLRNKATKFNEDELEMQIAHRFGEDDRNLPLCRSNETLFTPTAARSPDNKWYYVINSVLGVSQTYRVDICDGKHPNCNSVASFARGNVARCIQKFILRSMIAIDYDGKTIEKHFQVPSCCSCVYEATT